MSNLPIQIRRASAADALVLADHRVAMFRDMGSANPSIEAMLREAATTAILEAMAADEYVAWVAHPVGESDRVVAGAGVQLRRLLPRPDGEGKRLLRGREGIVLNVYVASQYRRRGIARRLMEEILAWVPTTDVVQLVLHASDEGRRLYESLGFVPTNEMRYAGTLRGTTAVNR